MGILLNIGTSILTSSLFSGVVIYFFKRHYDHKFNKSLENHKAELQKRYLSNSKIINKRHEHYSEIYQMFNALYESLNSLLEWREAPPENMSDLEIFTDRFCNDWDSLELRSKLYENFRENNNNFRLAFEELLYGSTYDYEKKLLLKVKKETETTKLYFSQELEKSIDALIKKSYLLFQNIDENRNSKIKKNKEFRDQAECILSQVNSIKLQMQNEL